MTPEWIRDVPTLDPAKHTPDALLQICDRLADKIINSPWDPLKIGDSQFDDYIDLLTSYAFWHGLNDVAHMICEYAPSGDKLASVVKALRLIRAHINAGAFKSAKIECGDRSATEVAMAAAEIASQLPQNPQRKRGRLLRAALNLIHDHPEMDWTFPLLTARLGCNSGTLHKPKYKPTILKAIAIQARQQARSPQKIPRGSIEASVWTCELCGKTHSCHRDAEECCNV
ncbi:hypothetical protein LCGC14_2403150 [marine sediment metagenome]|uniref:Uncharacterized protein n=1 Tax=marine sediment metagenome TaxID=412755 RepID=A0A0F9BUU7_9ZZZZ